MAFVSFHVMAIKYEEIFKKEVFKWTKERLTKFSWLRPHPERQTSLLSHSVARKFPAKKDLCHNLLPQNSLQNHKTSIILPRVKNLDRHRYLSHLVVQRTQNKEQDHISSLATSDNKEKTC